MRKVRQNTGMRELKQALRILRKSPGFTAVLLLTLALGIGANTAVFSIIDGVLLRPLPYRNPGRLVDILDTSLRESSLAKIFASYNDFDEFSHHAHSIDGIAAATWAGRPSAILTGRGPAKDYLTIPVTDGFFDTLGIPAKLGRTFKSADLRGGCAVVLSDGFWRGPLRQDPRIVGQSLALDDHPCTVLGVMPANFGFYPPETQIWSLLLPNDPRLKSFFGVFMVARLRPGVTVAQARTELTALHRALHINDINGEHDFVPLVSNLQDQLNWLAGRTLSATLAIVFVAVVLVLAIAFFNVTHLLMMKSLRRTREFATRIALGSSLRCLLRILLTESAVLTLAGGALGLLLAEGAIFYFNQVQPIELPVGATVSLNFPALLFTGSISAVAVLFFGAIPAWMAARTDVYLGLRCNGQILTKNSQRWSRALVAAETALSVILLTGACLLMRSVLNFGAAPLGFATSGVTVANGILPQKEFPDRSSRAAFYVELRGRIDATPELKMATIASNLAPYGQGLSTLEVRGREIPQDQRPHNVGEASVDADYFDVLKIPLQRGRAFDRHDSPESERVAIVNQALAQAYFPDNNPLGRKIRIEDNHDWLTIIGVSGNELRPEVFHEMSWTARPTVYMPISQSAPDAFSIAVRSPDSPAVVSRAIEGSLTSIDSHVATSNAETMNQRLERYQRYPRFRAIVLGGFALIALLLAAVGLYGVLGQFVVHRTHEIGVRIAVGADAYRIARFVMWNGSLPVLVGLGVGIAGSLAVTRYLSSLLYGVAPNDPATQFTVVATIIAAALAAMAFPTRRALRVDPLVALRTE